MVNVDDHSGRRVSMNSCGNVVAIGAYLNDDNGVNSGHVRVYQYNGGNWTKIGQDIDGEAANDNSGVSVSLNDAGDIVAIGAHRNDGNGVSSGHTRIFQYNGVIGINLDKISTVNLLTI